jgi:nitrate reductase NapE component
MNVQNLIIVVLGVIDVMGLALLGWVGYAVWQLRTYGLPSLPPGLIGFGPG